MAYWTYSNPTWMSLSPQQRVAAMALMEADGKNPRDAANVVGAIVNRAQKSGENVGDQVSSRIYQPTFEDSQEARLPQILKDPNFAPLTALAEGRMNGQIPDYVGGATHYLAPPSVMLKLESENPSKYKNWGPRGQNWTGYDEATGQYKNTILQDGSHVFLAPEGKNGGDNAPAPATPPTQVAGEDSTPSTAAPATETTRAVTPGMTVADNSNGGNNVFNLFSMLGAGGANMSGLGSLPSLASAAGSGADTLGDINPMGGMQNLFGQLGWGTTGQQAGGNSSQGDGQMAQNAMNQADQQTQQGMQAPRPTFNAAQLQKLLQAYQLGIPRKSLQAPTQA